MAKEKSLLELATSLPKPERKTWFDKLPEAVQVDLLTLRDAFNKGQIDKTAMFLLRDVCEKKHPKLQWPDYCTFNEWLKNRRRNSGKQA
jgi:hypothetical protein